MTHSLSKEARRLVDPELMIDPGQLITNPASAPARRGIYGWWFDPNALRDTPHENTIFRKGRHLLYVGICPSGTNAESRRTLRHRMKEHCRGPIRSSTLRRTLAALLAEELGLQVSVSPSGKKLLLGDGEARLSQWLSEHACVAWIEHEEPWTIEEELITVIAPPLNIKGSVHPNAEVLRAKRRTPSAGPTV